MTNLNKNQYKKLIDEAEELSTVIFCEYRLGKILVSDKGRAQKIYAQSIHRLWRRTASYNKLFNKDLYVPSWYIAKTGRENE